MATVYGQNIILDLNGHAITAGSVILTNYCDLTIRDSSTDKTGKIEGTTTSYMIHNLGGYNKPATLTVEGGLFKDTSSGYVFYNR